MIKPQDNQSNMKNANKGTIGTNRQYDQVHENRGKQLNPNQEEPSIPIEFMDTELFDDWSDPSSVHFVEYIRELNNRD